MSTIQVQATPARTKTKGYGALSATSALAPFSFARREPLPRDVQIDILYCGVCHSDLHTVRNEWKNTVYPAVPGHEIIGRVTAVGDEVTRFKPGDLAGVGCLVDSDRTCPNCRAGLEQYCDGGFTGTYNSPDKHLGGMTFGGYSRNIVVDQDFVLEIREKKTWRALRPCSARASPHTLRCATGRWAKGRKWALWGWAAWDTWA